VLCTSAELIEAAAGGSGTVNDLAALNVFVNQNFVSVFPLNRVAMSQDFLALQHNARIYRAAGVVRVG